MTNKVIIMPEKNTSSVFNSMRGTHIAMRVPNFEASKKWYVEKLDFRVLQEWPSGELQLAYLAPANDNNFYIELLAGGQPSSKQKYSDLGESLQPEGYHHFCIDVESVNKTLEEMKKRNINIIGEPFDVAEIGKRLAFIADIDGNVIELAENLNV